MNQAVNSDSRAGCILIVFLYPFYRGGNLSEEAHSALFPYDGSISFDKLGQGVGGFYLFFFQTMLAAGSWWVFNFVDQTLPGGLVT